MEVMARAIYAELEGPVANQDASRQMRQWNLAQTLAAKTLTALENAGCVVAPREATESMLDATASDDGGVLLPWRYTAMLSANPLVKEAEK